MIIQVFFNRCVLESAEKNLSPLLKSVSLYFYLKFQLGVGCDGTHFPQNIFVVFNDITHSNSC